MFIDGLFIVTLSEPISRIFDGTIWIGGYGMFYRIICGDDVYEYPGGETILRKVE